MRTTKRNDVKGSDRLPAFCASICGNELAWVDVRPEPWAEIDYCFRNVERKVAEAGGQMVLGWAILRTPLIFIAYHHAVWASPAGELVDITPPTFETTHRQTLFLRHDQATLIQVNGVLISRLSKYAPASNSKRAKVEVRRFRRHEWAETERRKRMAKS